jgi:PAS domain-containing protein
MNTFSSIRVEPNPRYWLRAGSLLISAAAATLLVTTVWTRSYTNSFSSTLLSLVLAALCIAIGLHVRFLILMKREQRETEKALHVSEREFESIFDSALDAIFILNDQGVCVQTNPAAQKLFAAAHPSPMNGSIHAGGDDFSRIWKEILARNCDHGETVLTRANNKVIFVEYTAKMNYLPGRHVAVLRDVSPRKTAEQQVARNLTLAESARAEADALRNITLALTQNLSMDYVLDTLLQSLVKLVPAKSASVMLCETSTRLFVGHELNDQESNDQILLGSETIDATTNPFLMRVLTSRKSLLILDTVTEIAWPSFADRFRVRSWLCVALIASDQVLGLLSLGHTDSHAFTQEHLRLTESLAIPASVAIQNARLYERASIYGIELEQRLTELSRAQQALRKADWDRK